MPITNATVVPIVYAAQLFRDFSRLNVFAARTDRTWQSQLANGGNTVRLSEINEGVVNDYVKGTPIVYTDADVTHLDDLTFKKDKYWAAKIEDIDAAMANVDVLGQFTISEAQKLADQVDADVRAEMDGSATAGPAVTIDLAAEVDANMFKFATMHRMLNAARVPQGGRWCILGPYAIEALQTFALQNEMIRAAGQTDALANGLIGNFAGFNMYAGDVGDSSVDSSGAKPVASETIFFGVDSATAYIDRIYTPQRITLESSFAEAVRGLYQYGAEVLHAGRIFKSAASITQA